MALCAFNDIMCRHFFFCIHQYEVASGCLIDNKFDFGSNQENFKLSEVKKHFKGIMHGLNYIGFVTFSPYQNALLSLREGLLRSVHLHFILLDDYKLPRRIRKNICSRVVCDDMAYVPLKIVRYPLQQAVAYVWKSPIFTAYSSIYNSHTDKLHNIRTKPSLKQIFKYYYQFQGYTLDEWTIAGGKGKNMEISSSRT